MEGGARWVWGPASACVGDDLLGQQGEAERGKARRLEHLPFLARTHARQKSVLSQVLLTGEKEEK